MSVVGGTALAVLGLGMSAADAQAITPAPAKTVNCAVGDGAGFGYEYLLKLKVTDTSCSIGDKVVRKKGKLSGWHCSQKVLQKDQSQFVGEDTCRATRGSASLVYEFTQLR